MDLEEIGINAGNWVDSAQDRNYWRAIVNAAFNLRVPYTMELVYIYIYNLVLRIGLYYVDNSINQNYIDYFSKLQAAFLLRTVDLNSNANENVCEIQWVSLAYNNVLNISLYVVITKDSFPVWEMQNYIVYLYPKATYEVFSWKDGFHENFNLSSGCKQSLLYLCKILLRMHSPFRNTNKRSETLVIL